MTGDIISGELAIQSVSFSTSQVRSVLAGVACAALAFSWQFLTVRYNYRGNWTGLFCTGTHFAQPPQLAFEHIYPHAGTNGYDGQYYHYVAHDPFFQRGFQRFVEGPRVRCRRILIPLAAHLAALGRDGQVDAAYFAVILLAVFCGAWWLSLLCVAQGFQPAWGLLFAAVPATVTSIDRMTVDVGLAALCIAFALCATQGATRRMYAVLAAAALVRETGLILVAGYVVYQLLQRQFARALIFATSAWPALAWYAFVAAQTAPEAIHWLTVLPSGGGWFSLVPFQGLVARLLSPFRYRASPAVDSALVIADDIAILFIGLAMLVAILSAWKRATGPIEIGLYLYALVAIFMPYQDAWLEVYGFGRVFSPLLILAGLHGISRRKWIAIAPVLLVGGRTLLQLAPQTLRILEGAL